MAKIGIRLADGKFYPILEEGAAAKKRLVVTTVKDDQPSVQIDVYRSAGGAAADAYVGSLIIENIPPRPSGEPDIRLDLGLDDDGNLNAFAREEATGEHQALAVSLKSLAEEEKYEIPDFDFQEDEGLDLSTDTFPEVNAFDTDVPNAAEMEDDMPDFEDKPTTRAETKTVVERTERKGVSPLLVGILAALGTAIVLIGAYFIYTYTANRQVQPPVAPPVVQAEPVKVEPVAPAPVVVPAPEPAKVEAPAPEPVKVEPAAPAPAAKPAAKIAPVKKAGTWYKIRWGDTLWDLSIAYYRTPWLYKTIAKANKIKNPDLIISATWIFIPPR